MRRVKILNNLVSPYAGFDGILEETQDTVVVKNRRYRRYNVSGVPARYIDVIIEDVRIDVGEDCEIQISRKPGKYDGALRYRVLIRRYNESARHISRGNFFFHLEEKEARMWAFKTGVEDPIIDLTFPRLRSSLEEYNTARIYMWHARRYFGHLAQDIGWDDLHAMADSWAAATDFEGLTLAEANRMASRELYRVSREHGWRKLTLRERARFGLDSQWVRQTVVAERLAKLQTVSDYTLQIARGVRK